MVTWWPGRRARLPDWAAADRDRETISTGAEGLPHRPSSNVWARTERRAARGSTLEALPLVRCVFQASLPRFILRAMTDFPSLPLVGLSCRAATPVKLSLCMALAPLLFGCSSNSSHSVSGSTQSGSDTAGTTADMTATSNSTTQASSVTVTNGASSSTDGSQSTSAGPTTTGDPASTAQGSMTSTVGVGGASSMSSSDGMTMTTGDGGTTNTGAGGTGGSALPPNPSGLPEPGPGGVARPSGTAGNLVVLSWAGFSGAISYSFDDANDTQINNEEQLLGLGVPFTWYLQTGKQQASNAFYQRALDAGHELANHTEQHGAGDPTNDVNQAQQSLMNQYGVHR